MFSKLSPKLISFSMMSTAVFAGSMGESHPPQGFFVGLGGSYNSVKLQQDSWGLGASNLYVNGTLTSQGLAQGTAAPFIHTGLTFAPEIQAGYLKNYNSDMYWGVKVTYQYLGLVETNRDLYLPQTGELRSFDPPSTSAMFGYAVADSVETTIDHDINIFALLGKQLGNKYLYLGVGPSVLSLRSQNYNSIGYALIDGETLNVTGLVNYSSPTLWAWGGAAQIGMSYFLDDSWFIDASYTYSIVGSRSTPHEQAFSNTSSADGNTIITTGILTTKDTFKPTSVQSLNISINKMFDL